MKKDDETDDDESDDDDDTGELVITTRNGDAHYPVAHREEGIVTVEDYHVEHSDNSTYAVKVREEVEGQPVVSGQRPDRSEGTNAEVNTETSEDEEQPDTIDTQTVAEDNNDADEVELQDTNRRKDEETNLKTVDREPHQTEPRRSARERKPPRRYEDYQMASMVPRPQDPRFQALQQVLGSGVLEELDSEMARRVVNSIFQ